MKEDKIIKYNLLIADFLDWKMRYDETIDTTLIQVPNNFEIDTGWIELEASGFMFNSDWNWLMHAWNPLHRDVLLPTMLNNPHLKKETNNLIKKMRKCLLYVHIDGAFETMGEIIEWYNSKFD